MYIQTTHLIAQLCTVNNLITMTLFISIYALSVNAEDIQNSWSTYKVCMISVKFIVPCTTTKDLPMYLSPLLILNFYVRCCILQNLRRIWVLMWIEGKTLLLKFSLFHCDLTNDACSGGNPENLFYELQLFWLNKKISTVIKTCLFTEDSFSDLLFQFKCNFSALRDMQILIHIGSAYIMDLMKRFESWAEYILEIQI